MTVWMIAVASAAPAPAPAPAAPAPAEPPPPPPAAAEGTLDGAPVRFASARAWTEGGVAVTVELNTSALSCAELGTARMLPEGERSAQFTVAPVLQKDGTRSWRVVRTWLENVS